MIILEANSTLAGGASAASQLTCTVFGMELNSTTEVETYKTLYQGQLSDTAATLYTATANGPTFIRTITVVNTNATTAYTFQFFRGGTASSNAISPIFTISAGGSATYEDGVGWSISTIAVGTTLLNDIHSGYIDMNAISPPSVPSAGTLRLYARTISGRTVPKWMPPSGVDTPFQTALYTNRVNLYLPNTGTTAGINLGTPWAVTATIAHPAPTAGIYTQIKRTTSTNVVTTANQTLGVSSIVSTAAAFWRGNDVGLGGFFFFARFGLENLTAGSPLATRLFVGLHSGTTNILASDTVPAISAIGLWHDTTDGADVITLLTKDGSNATKNTLAGSPTTPYATGQAYDFYLYAKPNDSVIYYRLDNLNTGAVLSDSSISTTIPLNNVFLGPNVGISNGTANTTAATVGIGIAMIYVEADR